MVRATASRLNGGQKGFTIIELMIALTVLLIGIAGIVALQITSLRGTAYSRHATEATVLAEDLMEVLRTTPIATLVVPDTDTVDAQGLQDPDGAYTRAWDIDWNGNVGNLEVRVTWLERGSESHTIVLNTVRLQ
jgi:type IV pilus assembly protein PilV